MGGKENSCKNPKSFSFSLIFAIKLPIVVSFTVAAGRQGAIWNWNRRGPEKSGGADGAGAGRWRGRGEERRRGEKRMRIGVFRERVHECAVQFRAAGRHPGTQGHRY